jgi:mannan endo-1,4-beta-mannosidase
MSRALPWVQNNPSAPYFLTEDGKDWIPIGHNDEFTWCTLYGLYKHQDMATPQKYFENLKRSGVTCLRIMLEYWDKRWYKLETRPGKFNPRLIQLWDDIFELSEQHGVRLLLIPFDSFWLWSKWKDHPYSKLVEKQSQVLTSPVTRQAIKTRFEFVIKRWGGSGALFAWDLWNEIHPTFAGNHANNFDDYINDISDFIRDTETKLYGKSHLQTVSVFGPLIDPNISKWKMESFFGSKFEFIPEIKHVIFQHPKLDFATTHLYDEQTIDDPKNTIDSCVTVANLVTQAISDTLPSRPYFESEHGPIHAFKDRKFILPEEFDDEYFRHIQWAHFASGAAGGGMRWPNRHPHCLTDGMNLAQGNLRKFLQFVDLHNFHRQSLTGKLELTDERVYHFACGDENQLILWMVRNDTLTTEKVLDKSAAPISVEFKPINLAPGTYLLTYFETLSGNHSSEIVKIDSATVLKVPNLQTDIAISLTPANQ